MYTAKMCHNSIPGPVSASKMTYIVSSGALNSILTHIPGPINFVLGVITRTTAHPKLGGYKIFAMQRARNYGLVDHLFFWHCKHLKLVYIFTTRPVM